MDPIAFCISHRQKLQFIMVLVIVSFIVGLLYSIIVHLPRSQWPHSVRDYQGNVRFYAEVSITIVHDERPYLSYRLDDIEPYASPSNTEYFQCIEAFQILNIDPLSFWRRFLPITFFEPAYAESLDSTIKIPKQVCYDPVHLRHPFEKTFEGPISGTLEMYANTYRYPYDELDIPLGLRFFGYKEDDGRSDYIQIPVNVTYHLSFPGWELKRTELEALEPEDVTRIDGPVPSWYPLSVTRIHLVRPFLYRLLTPVLLVCVVLFMILIPLIKDLGSFVEATTAMIFGLWGIRQVLLPTNVSGPTMLDPAFLILYVLLAVAILSRFTVMPLFRISKQLHPQVIETVGPSGETSQSVPTKEPDQEAKDHVTKTAAAQEDPDNQNG